MVVGKKAAVQSLHDQFNEALLPLGDAQVISGSGELFNHVDGNLPMWAGDGDRMVDMYISFVQGFAMPPVVTVGVCGMDSDRDANLRFSVEAVQVQREGFRILFKTWGDTRIARASVSWQAFGLSAN